MRFQTTHAQCNTGNAAENARQAARTIKNNLKGFQPVLVVFFAASDYEPHLLAAEMHDAFPGVATLGCTTAGEADGGTAMNASVVAMAFSRDVFEYCESALVLGGGVRPRGVDQFSNARSAMDYFGRKLGRKLGCEPIELDYREYVGFMLGDSISPFTERVVETVGEETNVIFVGGFAGDDYKFDGQQYVFYKGAAYKNAAVLSLWKPKQGFSLLKTQAVELTGTHLVITKADELNRIIWEFNHEDAALVYARAIHTPVETMGILDFDENPLALTVDGEPFLRAVVKQVDGRGLKMFAQVKEGTRQTLTRAGDIYSTTKEAMEKAMRSGDVAAILHVNCASRHTTLKNRSRIADFEKLFAAVPGVGFASYGEIHVGIVAMTSTMILFK